MYGDQKHREIHLRTPRKSAAEQGTKQRIFGFQTNMPSVWHMDGEMGMGKWNSFPLCGSFYCQIALDERTSPFRLYFFKTKQAKFNTSQIHHQDYCEMFNKSLNPNDRIG